MPTVNRNARVTGPTPSSWIHKPSNKIYASCTMHRCLLVPEILYQIFDFLLPRQTNASTLIALAITCKAFQHPALDILWKDLDDPLPPLVQCLPRDLWERDDQQIVSEILSPTYGSSRSFSDLRDQHLRRSFVEADLLTMRSYASRVRTFCSNTCSEVLHIDTYRAISLAAETPLMPNLRSLAWCAKFDQYFPYITLFLGAPQLTRININFYESSSRLSLLPRLKVLHPSIKEAIIDYADSPTMQAVEAISGLVCSWGSLTTLTCGPLTAGAWVHLSALPALRSLNTTLPAIDVTGIAFRCSFDALQLLKLSKLHLLMPCVTLINRMAPSHLKSLIINLPTSFTSAELRELFECLRKNTRHLQELSIQGFMPLSPQSEGHTIKSNTLKPLFSLPKLVSIRLFPNCSFNLDDMTLSQMAPSWPSLKTLILGSEHGWKRRSKLTLKSLLIILVHCPDLQELGIVIDATKVDWNPIGKPGGGFSHTTLTELHMGDSRVTSATMVGAFLSDIVPRVTTITAWQTVEMETREGGKKYQRRWEEVQRLLSTFAMVREQERQWSERTRIVDAPGVGSSMSLSETSDSSDDESSDDSPDP